MPSQHATKETPNNKTEETDSTPHTRGEEPQKTLRTETYQLTEPTDLKPQLLDKHQQNQHVHQK